MTHITAEQAQALLAYWLSSPGHSPPFVDFDLVARALIASEAARKLAERRLDKAVWALEPFANWAAYLGKDGPDNRRLSAHGAGLAYGDVRNAARITKEITE